MSKSDITENDFIQADILNLISEISMELNSISEISTILSVDSPLHKV